MNISNLLDKYGSSSFVWHVKQDYGDEPSSLEGVRYLSCCSLGKIVLFFKALKAIGTSEFWDKLSEWFVGKEIKVISFSDLPTPEDVTLKDFSKLEKAYKAEAKHSDIAKAKKKTRKRKRK